MRDEEFGRGQNTSWAGATPLLTVFPVHKGGGVAPACHRGTVIVFRPRAYMDVIGSGDREVRIQTSERRINRCRS